ncbi:unnamed protein product [Sphagnum balticum]
MPYCEFRDLAFSVYSFFRLLLLLVLDSFQWGCADFSQASNREEQYDAQLQKAAADSQLEIGSFSIEKFYLAKTQGKAQEKIKSAEDRLRQIEQKMEADKLCDSEAIGKELAKHLEDQKKLETEVMTTQRQTDAMYLHVRGIQAQQERRTLDAEKCVTGAETAVLEWIHQQFASLRSTLTVQQSTGGTGLY